MDSLTSTISAVRKIHLSLLVKSPTDSEDVKVKLNKDYKD